MTETLQAHFEVYPHYQSAWTAQDGWGVRDRAGIPNLPGVCESFRTKEEAIAKAELWERTSGDLISVEFHSPVTDYGGDRGTYTIRIQGSRFEWHGQADEQA